jgi:hypothetical protein
MREFGGKKGKEIFLQAWTGSQVSRNLRLPEISRQSAYGRREVVSPTHWPPLPPPPGNIPVTHVS